MKDQQPLTPVGRVGVGVTYAVLVLWAFIVLWPILQIIISSFNGAQGKYLILNGRYEFSLNNFRDLFQDTQYLSWLKNTVFIGVASAIIQTLVVAFTGYAYSRFRFKFKRGSLLTILLIQVIPTFAGITAYFTMHQIISGVIPPFTRQMMLVLIYSAGGIANNTLIMKGYIDSISTELDEAARMDGCSNFQVFRMIITPIVRPMLAIIALWAFIAPFTDYMLPKVLLTSPSEYTLATGLQTLIDDTRTMRQPLFAAGGLLTALPIVTLFIMLQKQLVSGLSSGSVKG
ncbi:sugar ABC transporter permease [uncultured Murdochiella sp.]|uniref:sugar ABC transporter permease n=1 Tax=uncultured Murdochiella sp. TaxID=1586095 RepID=UPI002805EF3F|nr:sugar ABC transporter permease [uncultured Murdochiella sp.]